jgi:hypothetical protein
MPAMARTFWLAFPLLWSAGVALAQTTAATRVSVLLPPGVPSETVHITYALGGSFGSYGQTVRVEPNVGVYSIPTTVEGKAAKGIQLVAWAPGCETRTYTRGLRGPGMHKLKYECVTLPAIILTGRIHPFGALAGRPMELAVFFRAGWECQFFGWYDCMVPTMLVATVTPDAGGAFQAQVPDFESDPVMAKSKGLLGRSGDFWMLLRDPKTLNHIAEMEPEIGEFRVPGKGLKVLSAYPPELVFLPSFTVP